MDGHRIHRPRLSYPVRTGMAALCALAVVAGITLPGRSADAAFPGANGKIAFDAPLAGPTLENITINPDGTGRAPVTGAPVNDTFPSWSPDGTRIVFVRPDPATPAQTTIWVINQDGTGATQLTFATAAVPANNARDDIQPAFSGDGTRIVFSRQAPSFERELWIMNADGSGQAKLTDAADAGSGGDFNPAWSPDSSLIAFDSEIGNGNSAIFTITPAGTGLTNITKTDETEDAVEPNFSPDGSRLAMAYCAPAGEGCFPHGIAVTSSAPGGAITPLTAHPAAGNIEDRYPAWSPDGTRVAFHREDFGNQTANIFTVPAAGGAAGQVSFGGQDRDPDWQPVARPAATPSSGAAGAARGKPCRKVPTTILGTSGKDFLVGTAGRDVIHGLRGRDQIFGLQGDDRLCGGRGFDKVFGGEGNDYLFGGDQHDFLSGGPGIDFLFGGTPSAPTRPITDTCRSGLGRGDTRNCQK